MCPNHRHIHLITTTCFDISEEALSSITAVKPLLLESSARRSFQAHPPQRITNLLYLVGGDANFKLNFLPETVIANRSYDVTQTSGYSLLNVPMEFPSRWGFPKQTFPSRKKRLYGTYQITLWTVSSLCSNCCRHYYCPKFVWSEFCANLEEGGNCVSRRTSLTLCLLEISANVIAALCIRYYLYKMYYLMLT